MSVTAVPLQPVKRSYIWSIWIAIVVAVVAAFLLARQGDYYQTTASGLRYHPVTVGAGARPTDDDVALVTYVGTLPDGTVFDQTQQPTPMPVNGVVPGFSEALKLMKKGARYRVWIPAKLGYGEKAAGKIPANTPLTFDLQLIDFLPRSVVEQYQRQMQMMNGGGAGGMGGPGGPGGVPGGAGGPPPGGGESLVPPPGQ